MDVRSEINNGIFTATLDADAMQYEVKLKSNAPVIATVDIDGTNVVGRMFTVHELRELAEICQTCYNELKKA